MRVTNFLILPLPVALLMVIRRSIPNVKVIINNEELKHMEYSGIFDNESVEQVIEALHITGNFNYKITKNVVTIW